MNSRVTSRYALLLFVAAGLFAVTPQKAYAQDSQYKRVKPRSSTPSDSKAKSSTSPKSDKVDISDLEKKYWAPKDTDFSVVQNRTYTKAKKVAVSLMAGPLINDPFTEGVNYGLSVNYFFDERHGVELAYVDSGSLTDSNAISGFKKLSGGGVLPDYGRVSSYYGLRYNWVPFYAKMSVLGKKIIYFDMVFSPGLGVTNYQSFHKNGTVEGSSATFSFDVSQYFFISKNIAIRADYRSRWYNEDIINYDTAEKLRTDTKSRSLFLFGVTYYH